MTAMDVREVLADPAQGGAYFVDARESDSLSEAASALEFSVTRIDLTGCRDKETVLDRIAQALHFPEWFGANFDALADSLGDLSWLPADGYLLLLEHADEWRQADDDNFATLLDILNEAAVNWGDYGVPFWALLPLPEEQLSKLAF
ncbi:MAG TPA: barstar family protein [Lysobacter sp.]|nr:barstar family protein [Lysobacter sp.]